MDPVSNEVLRIGYSSAKEQVNENLKLKLKQIKQAREQGNLSVQSVARCNSEERHVEMVLGLQKSSDQLIEYLTHELSKAIEERDLYKKSAEFDNEQFMSIGQMWLNRNRLCLLKD